VAGALERNQRLLEQLGPQEVLMLLDHIDRLTRKAVDMLAVEKELG
jgi:transcription termination factor Rho